MNDIIKINFDLNLLNRWEQYTDVKANSKNTYRRCIKSFLTYLQTEGIIRPTRLDIMAYRDYIASTHKATTTQTYLTAVKLFFRFLEQEGLYSNVADHVKGVKLDKGHKKDYLTEGQAKEVLSAIDTGTLKGKRDYAIISLMLTTGLRTIEVARANVDDIKLSAGQVVLYIQGKGRSEKAEFVKIAPPVETAIRAYLNARKDKGRPLFVSTSNNNNNKRLTTRTISQIAKDSMLRVGLNSDRLTAHSLRHTTGTLALLHGASTREVQQVLRHKSINTTLIYTHDLERASNNCEMCVAGALF